MPDSAFLSLPPTCFCTSPTPTPLHQLSYTQHLLSFCFLLPSRTAPVSSYVASKDRKVCRLGLQPLSSGGGHSDYRMAGSRGRVSLTLWSSHPRPIPRRGQGLGKESKDPIASESSRPWYNAT